MIALSLTVGEALAYAAEFTAGATMHADSRGVSATMLVLADAVRRQHAEIAALRADAERLDFLDRNLEKRLGWEVGFAPAGTVCVTRIFPPNNEPTPIRAAIDAARANIEGEQHD